MERRRVRTVVLGALALVAGSLALTPQTGSASAPASAPAPVRVEKSAPEAGFADVLAIGGLSEPVGAAFAPDGTAFLALKTGLIKSFDPSGGGFEAAASSTDFADLTGEVNNYGDRGLTGITVDPRFPARPYVYVNYTYDKDPVAGGTWGTGQAYDNCGPNDANEATLSPAKRGCPVQVRVSRLTATRGALGWVMQPGSELVLVQNGCAQFSSHASGDVAFGPDGKLYASAGDGASFKGQDYGQANAAGYQAACPNDPTDEGGSLRAQDQRTGGDPVNDN